MQNALTHLEDELKKVRTGRAHPSVIEGVMVEAYGVPTPLNQVANITAPEAQLLQITPFDPTNLAAISNAIRADQSLGLNPADDGRVIRCRDVALGRIGLRWIGFAVFVLGRVTLGRIYLGGVTLGRFRLRWIGFRRVHLGDILSHRHRRRQETQGAESEHHEPSGGFGVGI